MGGVQKGPSGRSTSATHFPPTATTELGAIAHRHDDNVTLTVPLIGDDTSNEEEDSDEDALWSSIAEQLASSAPLGW